MRTHPVARPASFAAALALGALSLAAPARAEDPAPAGGAPKPMAKSANAFFDGLVGSWDATVKAGGIDLKGTDRWRKVAGGTAWLHELRFGEGAGQFHGLGVVRLRDGGKATMWWFDSMGKGAVWTFQGTVTDDGFEFASEEGGMKVTKALKKAEGGLAYRMTRNGEEMVAGSWKKAAKPVADAEIPKECPLAQHPFVKAQLGDWSVATSSMGQDHTGKSNIRLGVGGHYVLEDHELAGDDTHKGFGVSSVSADGKTMRVWWFGNYFVDPFPLAGPLTDKEWKGTGKHPVGVESTVQHTITDAGMEGVVTAGGMEVMREKYTRAKAAK